MHDLALTNNLALVRRWDTHQHRLADHPAVGHPQENFPGQDYSNPRVKDFANGNKIRAFCGHRSAVYLLVLYRKSYAVRYPAGRQEHHASNAMARCLDWCCKWISYSKYDVRSLF